jgi:hypothetical protein
MKIGLVVYLVEGTSVNYKDELNSLIKGDVVVSYHSSGSVSDAFNKGAKELIGAGCDKLVFLQSYAKILDGDVISVLAKLPGHFNLVSDQPNLLEDYLFCISSEAFSSFDSLYSTYLYLYDFFIKQHGVLGISHVPSVNISGVSVDYSLLPIKSNFEYFFSNDEEYFAVKYGVRISQAGSLVERGAL